MAHAAVNAALSKTQGNNALAGAAGAATAEMMAPVIIGELGWDKDHLSEEQKQVVSALSTLAAGLAGGVAGDGTSSAVSGAQAGKTTVENNYLSSKNVLDMRRELEGADKSGADKTDIYEKYANISKKNREEAVDKSCSGNPFCANGALQEAQGGSDIANSLNRLPAFSSLNSEDLAQLDRFVMAENEESARAIYQSMPDYVKVALNGKEAVEALGLGAAIGGKSLAALGVIGKAAKGSAIPVPEPIKASNGLNYQSNPKHTPGTKDFGGARAGIEPKNSLNLFETSISLSGGKKRFSMDSDGNIHQFMPDGLGNYHWAGSTADKKNPLILDNKVKSELRKQIGWKIK